VIRVLIADDQSIIRAGLATILDAQSDIEVVGQSANGREAIDLAQRLRPDVCLLDITMPGVDGIAATKVICDPTADRSIAVVIITTFDTDDNIHAALEAGARGFLLKDAPPDQLTRALRAAANGDALIDPSVTARLLDRLSAANRGKTPVQPIEPLTEREEEVLLAVADGRTNHEIATELFISTSTVKFHLAGLMSKIKVRNRVELAKWAYETGRTSPTTAKGEADRTS